MSWFDTNQPAAPMRGPSLGSLGTDPVTDGTQPMAAASGGSIGNQQQALQAALGQGLQGQAAVDWVQQNYPQFNEYGSGIEWQPSSGTYGVQGGYEAQNPSSGSWGFVGTNQGGASGGGASQPGMQNIPGMDPGYQFQFGQAIDALNKSAAAKGTLLTGGTLKAIADYAGNDLASSAYQGAFNRTQTAVADGLSAANPQGASSYANNAANTITNNGQAQGGASIAQGNAYSGAFGSLGNLGMLYALNRNSQPNTSGYLPSTNIGPGYTTLSGTT